MAYYLGIDIGTTYSAAAVWRDGQLAVANLGERAPVIPSVLFIDADGSVVVGEAAERRGPADPRRMAREFKRRVGDPTPIIVGGTPYSADALMSKLLRWVFDKVVALEGGRPDGLAVSYPANWGAFKQDLLAQEIRLADLGGPAGGLGGGLDVATLTEPEAAAIYYAAQERVADGAVVAVYDLGGGTFDVAVLRKVANGWQILGEPEGIERLGGIDFDEAVFQHVTTTLGDEYESLDPDDDATLQALTRLRRECVEAKEALSEDTDVTIPVLLPGIQRDVRLTRVEFEDMIRPALTGSIEATKRALRAAKLDTSEVTAVLLVGGSSRVPLVGQLVGASLGRPVAIDVHPKHGIALGAATLAAERALPAGPLTTQITAIVPAAAPMAEALAAPAAAAKAEAEAEAEKVRGPAGEAEAQPKAEHGAAPMAEAQPKADKLAGPAALASTALAGAAADAAMAEAQPKAEPPLAPAAAAGANAMAEAQPKAEKVRGPAAGEAEAQPMAGHGAAPLAGAPGAGAAAMAEAPKADNLPGSGGAPAGPAGTGTTAGSRAGAGTGAGPGTGAAGAGASAAAGAPPGTTPKAAAQPKADNLPGSGGAPAGAAGAGAAAAFDAAADGPQIGDGPRVPVESVGDEPTQPTPPIEPPAQPAAPPRGEQRTVRIPAPVVDEPTVTEPIVSRTAEQPVVPPVRPRNGNGSSSGRRRPARNGSSGSSGGRGGRIALLAAVAALVVVLAGVLFNLTEDDNGAQAGGGTTTTAAPQQSTTSEPQQDTTTTADDTTTTTESTTPTTEPPPQTVEVPDVSGQSQEDAIAALDEQGISVGSMQEEPSDDIPEGLVTRTDPSAGSTVDPDSSVVLFISTGPDTASTVPDVTGATEADAIAQIEDAGFTASSSTTPVDDPTLDGIVVGQSPGAGEPADPGDPIDITIGDAP